MNFMKMSTNGNEMYSVKHKREDQHLLDPGHAAVTPQLDVHSHCNPALPTYCQQLSQFPHLFSHGNKVIICQEIKTMQSAV